jgi:hypothetical protein
MGWVGTSRVSRQFGKGNDVRIGDFVMPKQAEFAIDGANGDPDLRVFLEVRDGRPQVVDVHVTAKPDGRSVRTSDLQLLSLDALTVSVFSRLAMRSTYDPERNITEMSPIADEREFWQAVNATDEAVKAPRRGSTRAELEQVAKVYRENVDHKPVAAVQAVLGYGSERTAARRIKQAENAGLLPSTTPGKRRTADTSRPAEEAPAEQQHAPQHPKTKDELRAAIRERTEQGRPDLAVMYAEQLEAHAGDDD